MGSCDQKGEKHSEEPQFFHRRIPVEELANPRFVMTHYAISSYAIVSSANREGGQEL
jgi:hypothetical protein